MGVSEKISRIIAENLAPLHCEVINESGAHSGHAGDDGSGESHFRLVIVSQHFAGLTRVARHRMVYNLLKNNLQTLPHALAIEARSPEAGQIE